MYRLVAVLVFSMLLLQAVIFPASAQADVSGYECPAFTHTFLSVTNITSTSAIASVKICMTGTDTAHTLGTPDNGNSVILQYGTEPGVYTNKIQLEGTSGSRNTQLTADGETHCWDYRVPLLGLTPCTTYYVRFWFIYDPEHGCTVFDYHDQVFFKTLGCLVSTGPMGSGGTGTGTAITQPVQTPVQMASVTVQSAAVTASKVSPGQDVDIAASVTNKGTANGDAKLTLYVNGEAVESKGVTVASGQSVPVHFSVSRNEPGTYDVYINSVPAGSFEVNPFNNNDILVCGIIALFVIGIAGTLYFIRRRLSA